jgi:uncharacterized membrane protein
MDSIQGMSASGSAQRKTNRNVLILIGLIVGMIAIYLLRLGVFALQETPGVSPAPTKYNMTMLHVFVVLAGIVLPLPYALIVGLTMGTLSTFGWREFVAMHGGELTIASFANYYLPRLLIPVPIRLIRSPCLSMKHRSVGVGILTITGCLTNTVLYGSMLVLRLLFLPHDGELASLGLSIHDVVQVCIKNGSKEIGICYVAVFSLDLISAGVFLSPELRDRRHSDGASGAASDWEAYLSYADHDAETAAVAYASLTSAGIKAYFAQACVASNADWIAANRSALFRSRLVVVVATRHRPPTSDEIMHQNADLATAMDQRKRVAILEVGSAARRFESKYAAIATMIQVESTTDEGITVALEKLITWIKSVR